MATKVMLAPALARSDVGTNDASRAASVAPKAKRRRSSVYDADGNEVFITLVCLKCRRTRPLSQFGLRRMADGAIRNQPWCRACRSGTSADNDGRKRARSDQRTGDSSVSGESYVAAGSPEERVVDPGTLAAQVLAALSGGRR
jgi:hypothetical protein